MKTPWRFLSDLVSRKTPEDRPAEQIVKTPDVIAIDHHPDEEVQNPIAASVEHNADETETDPVARDVGTIEGAPAVSLLERDVIEQSVDPVDTASEAATKVQKDDHVGEITHASDVTEASPGAPLAKERKAKQSGNASPAQSAVNLAEGSKAVQASIEKTVYDEMAALDQEIAELRRLLSEKLLIQNSQLKALLERY